MKKNLLIAAIAAFVSQGTFAAATDASTDAGDISNPDHKPVTFAAETFSDGTDSDGYQKVDILPSTQNINMPLGIKLQPDDPSVWIRIDLDNAEFGPSSVLDLINEVVTASSGVEGIAQLEVEERKSGAGRSYVVFEVWAPAATETAGTPGTTNIYPDTTVISLVNSDNDYLVTEGATQITYSLFAEQIDAFQNNRDGVLSTFSAPFTAYAEANTGVFSVSQSEQALSASGFKEFANGDSPKVIGSLGIIQPTLLLGSSGSSSLINAADTSNAVVTVGNIIDSASSQNITITGDFSFGSWTLNTNSDCTTAGTATSLVKSEGNDSATAAIDLTAGNYHLCIDNTDRDKMNKGSYIATLEEADLTATIGELTYDTTSIDIDYLTTTPGYVQRLFLVNRSGKSVDFSTTFSTESGVEANAKDASSGTLAGNEYRVINVTDFVEFVGPKLRGGATIEVEGSIEVTTQTYNAESGATDTVKITD